jgi:hypothetical protein
VKDGFTSLADLQGALLEHYPDISMDSWVTIVSFIAKHTKVDMIWVAGRSPTLVSQNLKATTLTYLAIIRQPDFGLSDGGNGVGLCNGQAFWGIGCVLCGGI